MRVARGRENRRLGHPLVVRELNLVERHSLPKNMSLDQMLCIDSLVAPIFGVLYRLDSRRVECIGNLTRALHLESQTGAAPNAALRADA
jgi:hypothetical protein